MSTTVRALFVNENLGGHRTLHLHLRRALASGHPGVAATFFDVPRPRGMGRLAAAPVPGLDRIDADLQPLRYELAQSLVVRRKLRTLGPGHDVLHAYSQNAVLLSAGALRSRPSVVSTDTTNRVNAYELPYRRPGPFTPASVVPAAALERRVFAAATLVVAQSAWTANQLLGYGVEPERLRIVPFGLTVPPLERRTSKASALRITFIGSGMDRKGGTQLLRVFSERLAHRCRLTLVTRDAVPPRPGVEVVCDADPGDDRLDRILAESDLFVLPTEIDKAPFAVLEAMAAGLPVVATGVGAIPEMVPDGVAGMLVPVGDDRALARAIETLLDDPARRRRMGAEARRRVLDHYDARRTTADLVRVLEEARARHATDRAGSRGFRATRAATASSAASS